MYLHIGENVSIPEKDIIGIFDLSNSEHAGISITISKEMPKSFIVVSDRNDNHKQKIYISPISVSTLKQRAEKGFNFNRIKE